jgi:hypothetical protein
VSGAVVRFWGSAIAVAAGFAAAAALLLPYDALGLGTEAERWRAWLLTVWTAGVMAALFGASAVIGAGIPLGYREVAEAGSVMEALRMRHGTRRGTRRAPERFHRNFAWWLVCTGGLLIALYFGAWTMGG